MKKFYSSLKNPKGRVPQITTGAKKLLLALSVAVLFADNAAAQWASITYKVWPKSLTLVNCNPGGTYSDFSGKIGFQDDDGTGYTNHSINCVYLINGSNFWDGYAFSLVTNQAQRVTVDMRDCRDDDCDGDADNCHYNASVATTKNIRSFQPSALDLAENLWPTYSWGYNNGNTTTPYTATTRVAWKYVTIATDPIIQLSTCPGEIVETYGTSTNARIPSWAVSLTAGTTYEFSTCGSSFDTYLSIFGSNGYTVLASANEGCGNNQSVLSFTCPATGVYFLELTKWVSDANTRGSFTEAFEIHMATIDDQAPTGINAANPLSFDTLYTCSSAQVPALDSIPPVRNFRDNCSSEPAQINILPLFFDYPTYDWENGVESNWSLYSEIDPNDLSAVFPWSVTNETASTGFSSIKCSGLSDGSFSRFTTTINQSAAVTMSFDLKTDTEYGYDFLQFMVDDEVRGEWSGYNEWTQVLFEIPAGQHALEWRYQKDVAYSVGEDACWIDNIIIPMPLAETVIYSFPETHTRAYSIFDDAGNSTVAQQVIYAGNVDQLLADGIVYDQGVLSTASLNNLINSGGDTSGLDMYNFAWIDCDNNSTVLSDQPTFTIPANLQDHRFSLRCDFMGACEEFTPCFYYDVLPPSGHIDDLFICNASELPAPSDVVVVDLTDNFPDMPIQVSLESESPNTSLLPQVIVRTYALTDAMGNSSSINHTITLPNLDVLLGIVQYASGVLSLAASPDDWAVDQYLYQWVDCNNNNAPISGATSPTYAPTVSGSYALLCDFTSGPGAAVVCSALSACTDVTIASVENEIATQFTVYPNPNNTDELHFNYNGTIEHVSIYNVVGELVLSNNTMGSKTINIASLAPGEYIVKMHSAAGDLTNPLIVTE